MCIELLGTVYSHDLFLSFFSFEEPCYVGRHLTYVVFVGITQIILYAVGLPALVFVFLWRHRDELNKPVVKFRYGLFFAGFRQEKYYWECVVALRKESTVLLAVFGPQMGIPMLAHVALLVFQVQILVQLIGHPYDARQIKLQVLDVASIIICWGTMWSGFFFYSPRPPSQKPALEFLTVLVVSVNVVYMLVLLYSMCSETCREHEDNSVVKMFRKRTSNMTGVIKRRVTGDMAVKRRRGTQTVENPTMQQQMVEIEMPSRHNNSGGGYYSTSRPDVEIEMSSRHNTSRPETLPSPKNIGGETKRKNRAKKNKINKIKSRKTKPKKQQAPVKKTAAQQERRNKLKSIHAKRESLDAINNRSELVEKERDVDAVDVNTHKRRSFLKIDDEEHGVYFQDVDTEETVWELPKDGDVVVEDTDELQQNPMKRKSFIKIVDDEHGVFFQDVETEESVWELPEDGDLVVEDDELQQNPMKRQGRGGVQ